MLTNQVTAKNHGLNKYKFWSTVRKKFYMSSAMSREFLFVNWQYWSNFHALQLPLRCGPSVFRAVFFFYVVFLQNRLCSGKRKASRHTLFWAVRYSTGRGSSGCGSYFGSFFMNERLGNTILESKQVTASWNGSQRLITMLLPPVTGHSPHQSQYSL